MKLLRSLLIFFFSCGVLGLIVAIAVAVYFSRDLPDVTELKDVQLQTPMLVYTNDGVLISQFGEKRRIPLAIEQIPQQMKDAFLAVEDSRFYDHPGIDLIGVTRAFVSLVTTGEKRQGASTITMQVARNFYLTRDKTYRRKIREILLAWRIEQLLTKDQILELYLNKIPLGYRAHGVGAAAEVYFGKTVDQLTLPEIAMIAGLPKAPSILNPIYSVENAVERRNVVLARMLAVEAITREQFKEAMQAPLEGKYHGPAIEMNAPYVAEMARQYMVERYGEERAYTSGFKVFTTIDSKQQQAAIDAVVQNLLDYDHRHGYRGAIANPWLAVPELDDQSEQQQPLEPVLMLPEPMWDQTQVIEYLKQYRGYQHLVPAMVMTVAEQSAQVIRRDGTQGTINWDGMKWARAFITDERQGAAPKTAAEIVQPGDVIMTVAATDGSLALSQLPEASAALIALNPKDAAIRALVGGFSFAQSQFNRAFQAKRQLGSNIKPFIYSAAFDNGYSLASLVADAPISHWDASAGVAWRPKNSPEVYDGDTRLRLGLAQSKNVMSVRLLRAVGIEKIRQHLSKFGFPLEDIPPNESLALGSASFAPLDVANGFAIIANGGYQVKSYLIERIEDQHGNRIFQQQPKVACPECEALQQSMTEFTELTEFAEIAADQFAICPALPVDQAQQAPHVVSDTNTFLVTQAMNSAIWGGGDWSAGTGWNGTGWRAARALKRRDIAGKTGTTNDAKDAWFSGFHPNLVATSWIGFDDHRRKLGSTAYNPNLGSNQITGKEFGAKTALPAWIKFMQVALQNMPVQSFTAPDNIVSVRIDRSSGLLTHRTDSSTRFEYFVAGSEPTQYAESLVQPVDPFIDNEVQQPATVDDELF
ncbi:penicillin-binding protein 1A [Neiella litorisoli]